MKHTSVSILLLLLLGCGESNNIASRFKISIDLQSKGISASRMNQFPHGFIFKNVQEFDSLLNMEVGLVLPVAGVSKLDAFIESDIRNQLSEFKTRTADLTEKFGPHPFMPGSFYCYTENIWEDSFMISYLMVTSFYNGIGVHGMTTYYTCNFDKRKNRIVGFNDFFEVKTAEDTAFLFNSIVKAVNQEGLWLETIYAMDFHLRDSTVVFAYDDYEIASYAGGIIQAPIRKSEISSLIKPEYR